MENRNNQSVLNYNSNLFHVKVNGYGDEIVLNTSDARIFEKFTTLYENLQNAADKAERNMKAIGKKYNGEDADNLSAVKDYVKEYIAFSQDALKEFDEMFGAGFTKKVFRENYEIDENFVPDEGAITDLIDSLLPIMEEAYGKRIKQNREKYSAGKRGKHNKTKDELIQEYKEKNGANE